ncbi:MAG TPA: nucleotide sugar dehydrogenase, partial [Candidatus Methanoperedens sp.]
MNSGNATGFAGLTHLGVVSSICWASKFPSVIAIDPEPGVIGELTSGRLPVEEPLLAELFDKNRKNISFSTDFSHLSGCSTIFITRDIKTDEDNLSDYESFYDLIERTIPYLSDGTRIVLMSQVSVGTCRNLKKYIKRKRPDFDFELIYMVETLIIGNAVDRFLHPERIILGTESGIAPDNFGILRLNEFGAPLIFMKYESAELTKLAINFYLFNSVIYANTIADLCEAYGADMNEIIPALRLDKRIGTHAYIRPGLGVTGGNLERDMMTLRQLEEKKGICSDVIDLLINLNKIRYRWVEKKLKKYLFHKIEKPRICIWGLAYKKDTASLKNSISLRIIEDLSGSATFVAYDPLVKSIGNPRVNIRKDRYDAARGAHCLIVTTDPDEFKALDIEKLRKLMKYPFIIDCINLYSARSEDFSGFKYIAIGKAADEAEN